MDTLEYNIVLKTPIGYRVGTMMVEIKERLIQGIIRVLGKEETYKGDIDDSGNIAVVGKLPTPDETIQFSGKGKISGYAVHLTIPGDDFTFELDGTSQR